MQESMFIAAAWLPSNDEDEAEIVLKPTPFLAKSTQAVERQVIAVIAEKVDTDGDYFDRLVVKVNPF